MTAAANGKQTDDQTWKDAISARVFPPHVRYEFRISFWHQGIGWLRHCEHNTEQQALDAVTVLRNFWADKLGLARVEKVRVITTEQVVERKEV